MHMTMIRLMHDHLIKPRLSFVNALTSVKSINPLKLRDVHFDLISNRISQFDSILDFRVKK